MRNSPPARRSRHVFVLTGNRPPDGLTGRAVTKHRDRAAANRIKGDAKFPARGRREATRGRGLVDRTPFPSEDLRDSATSPTDLAHLWLTGGNMNDGTATGAPRRQLSLQQQAVEQLRALAKPYRFRVQADVEGFPIIPGRYGRIEWFDGSDLAVYSDRPRVFGKLWAIPGVRRHQTGDSEMRAVFLVEALEQVARVIRAHRKPGIGSEVAKKIGSTTAFGGTSRPQKTRFESTKGLRLGAAARPESEAAK